MFIFNYAVLVIGIIVIVVALYYTRLQFAGNKEIVDRYKEGGGQAPSQASAHATKKTIDV